MKPNLKMLVSVLLGLAITSIGCSLPQGACTFDLGISQGCFPTVHTEGSCSQLNGRFHLGETCQSLGFPVTDDSENSIVGGITGV